MKIATRFFIILVSACMMTNSIYAVFKKKRKEGDFIPLKNIAKEWPHNLVTICSTVRVALTNQADTIQYGWEFIKNVGGDVLVQINGGQTQYIDPYLTILPTGFYYCKKANSAPKVNLVHAVMEGFFEYQGVEVSLNQRYYCADSQQYWMNVSE